MVQCAEWPCKSGRNIAEFADAKTKRDAPSHRLVRYEFVLGQFISNRRLPMPRGSPLAFASLFTVS